MTGMSRLDLKDLLILEQICKTRNVSQAVDGVGLSQPSISVRLGHLRRYFRDPLFVRTAAGMQPTPRVEAMLPAIHHALGLLGGASGQPAQFEARISDRTFRICMTDAGQIVILPRLLARLQSAAPGIRIEVLNLDAETPRLLESGNADIAMGFTIVIQAGFYQQKLFREHFVCMISREHPRIGPRMTRKQFLAEGHIAVATRGTAHSLLLKSLDDAGVRRRVALNVPSFLGLAQIVKESELIALVPAHLGAILAREGEVRLLPPPIKLAPWTVRQYWHERYHRDAGNRWLRSVTAELFAEA